jgi:hypothetical protein
MQSKLIISQGKRCRESVLLPLKNTWFRVLPAASIYHLDTCLSVKYLIVGIAIYIIGRDLWGSYSPLLRLHMDTYITAYPAHPLGRWLATFAVSLVLLALAYASAPDPAGQLGLTSHSARSLANRRPALTQRGHRFATGQAPALVSAQLSQPAKRVSSAQLAR